MSKIKSHIAEILQQEGFITGWKTEDAEVGKNLTLELKFGPNRERSIAGIKRISKPGLRVYAKSTNLPKVLGGLGVAIISTSHGLLTDKQAEEEGRRRRSPRLRLVTEGNGGNSYVAHRQAPHRGSRRMWTSPSTAVRFRSRAPRAR